MHKQLKLIISLFIIYLNSNTLFARSDADSFLIGQRCPALNLRNIEGWKKKVADLNDFRGKWLVLDFWNKGCGACVASFPKTNQLMAKYGDKVSFMLVALQDKQDDIHPLWHKFRDRQKLTMPCAFDSLTFKQFGFYACPQVIVIDDKGIVRAAVNGISATDLDSLLTGQKTYITKPAPIVFNWQLPFLLNGNGGNDTDFAYRCILSNWNSSMGDFRPGIIAYAEGQDLFQVSKVSLGELFDLAYFGKCFIADMADPDYAKICLHPLLEIYDTAKFSPNYYTGSNLFAYSIKIPGAKFTQAKIKTMLQQDLANYFRYSADVEIRDCPYLALVATDSARKYLATKGGAKFRFEGCPNAKFTYYNTTVANFLFVIGMSSFTQDPVLVDETGIIGNIDITMDEIATDQSSVMEALHQNGLNLLWKKKPMSVVVIKDSGISNRSNSLPDTNKIPWE